MLSDVMWNTVKGRLMYCSIWYYIRDDPEALKRLNAQDEAVRGGREDSEQTGRWCLCLCPTCACVSCR